MGSSILVTGGAGFIGSHVVDRLLVAGHAVTTLDNFNSFYDPALKRENITPHRDFANYRLVEGDIRDQELVDRVFAQGNFTEIIHLAAMAGVRPSIQNPVLYQEVNLIGTMNLLEASRARGIKRFVFASSSSVYGNNRKVPFSETDPVDHPISPYASTKKSGELMVFTYHHLYQIDSACLRFFTVYGPRQRPEMAISLFTDKIARGQTISVFGDGRSRRDYTFVDDIVDGILRVRERLAGYEVYNLGRSDTVELGRLVEIIEQKLGRSAVIERKDQQAGDVDQTFADISKARQKLGFEPKVSIEDGIEQFVAWYTRHRLRD